MEQLSTNYLNIIKTVCTNSNSASTIPADQKEELFNLSKKHCTVPFLLPYYASFPQYSSILQQTKQMLLYYYQIEHFTQITISLLKEEGIDCYLLKGISLAEYYPVPEYRKLGDVDLYLAEKKLLEKAKSILEVHGYQLEDELSDHHLTYHYTFPKTNRHFILELHYRVIGQYQYEKANQIVDSVFSEQNLKKAYQTIHGYTYTVLPPDEYVFYMLHHMLKHYLYTGFGIRLLTDFTLYLKAHASDINFNQIHTLCKESKIMHFYEITLESCRKYLGLPDTIDPTIHYSADDCTAFMEQILDTGDMGTDVSRTLVGSGSYQKINLFTYFREGHVQMKVRYPKARKFWILWPALWTLTFIHFIYNTYTLRHTTFMQTIRNFKKTNQKTKLIHIFENSDS